MITSLPTFLHLHLTPLWACQLTQCKNSSQRRFMPMHVLSHPHVEVVAKVTLGSSYLVPSKVTVGQRRSLAASLWWSQLCVLRAIRTHSPGWMKHFSCHVTALVLTTWIGMGPGWGGHWHAMPVTRMYHIGQGGCQHDLIYIEIASVTQDVLLLATYS